jgi:hypothetical protein
VKATSSTDVHNCRSLTCMACSQSGSVVFVRVDKPNKVIDPCKTEISLASTAPSSPSPSSSQRVLTPPPSIQRKHVIFENISSVGVIRAFSSNPTTNTKTSQLDAPSKSNVTVDESPKHNDVVEYKKQDEMILNVPYKLTRSRSLDSLDRFIASIEAVKVREQEEDVDQLMFGTPWKHKELA